MKKINKKVVIKLRFYKFPDKTEFSEDTFDLGLSSHFLLMYTALGYDFYIKSINKMLRICRGVRIFPIVDLDGNKSELTNKVIDYFEDNSKVELISTSYEFQKCDNLMLSIKK